MKTPVVLFRPPSGDPGPLWAEELLAPLRREEFCDDLAPGVMRRIAASVSWEKGQVGAHASPDLKWVASLLAGCAGLALLTVVLAVMVVRGDEGVHTLWVMGASAGRLLLMLGGSAATLAAELAAAALVIVRKLYVAFAWLAPVMRGGGIVGAACGVMSIIISATLFARAGRAAPAVGLHRKTTLLGGSR